MTAAPSSPATVPSPQPDNAPAACRFDPFNDRRARDIRNRLSRLFMEALARGDMDVLESWFRRQDIGPPYRPWAEARLQRYRELVACSAGRSLPALAIFCWMWNKELFFECHELVEEEWRRATGRRRAALQGLIQAAGFYVHSERGAQAAAARIGRKAVANLRGHREQLPAWLDVETICVAIETGSRRPPRLSCPDS